MPDERKRMPVRSPRQFRWAAFLQSRPLLAGSILSLCLHMSAALYLVQLNRARIAMASVQAPYEVVFSATGAGRSHSTSRHGKRPHERTRPEPGGARVIQNIDAQQRGEGGERHGAQEAIYLMHRDQGILLFDSPLNNLAVGQSQRIRTASQRATLEERRATPNPEDEVFLASGEGPHRERRPVSQADPHSGARIAPTESLAGNAPASPSGPVTRAHAPEEGDAQPQTAQGGTPGTEQASPGQGILEGRGRLPREGARVARARPSIDEGPAATQARRQDARIRDNRDAELLATRMMQSWVESTERTGPETGPGRGGVGSGGVPGSGGGQGVGGRASTYGPGRGRFQALDTRDQRYRRWFVTQRRRVERAIQFPRSRALAMDQGTSVFRLVVQRDGTLTRSPQLIRSSGFDDFDSAARRAIQASLPFESLPQDLAPERSEIRIQLPVEFSNPMIQ